MDTQFLQTFIVVVDTGSIAEAARRLGITPSSVTQRVRALEVDVGNRLIERAGRTVKPTLAGLRIVERAHTVLRHVADLRSEASDTALPAGPLRLGATPSALTGIVPTVLKRWVTQHPHINIFIEPGTTTTLYAKVLAGDLDAAILVHPRFELPKTCVWQTLRDEPLVLVTPAAMKGRDPLAIARREPFIQYDRGVIAGKMADEYLRAQGIRPNVRFELDGIESIAKLVAEGLGVSVLPDWPVLGPANTALKRWPLPAPCPSREVGAIWLRASVRSPLARAFADMARATLPQTR